MAQVELTVLLPVLNERDNLEVLLPRLARVLEQLDCSHEVLIVDGGSRDGTAEVARQLGARVIVQQARGYGLAVREGFGAAAGEFILTLDADLSHDPDFIIKMWRARHRADIVIASRYTRGGVAIMPWQRLLLSGVLNRFFATVLSLPVRDLSSGFRLHRRAALADLTLVGRNFEIIEEVLVKAFAAGWRVLELPFTYYPRHRGTSNARIFVFGIDLLKACVRLWGTRNAVGAADHDERTFHGLNPLRRRWQRQRHRIVTLMARGQGRTLDVGCGSNVILQSLNNAVGLDLRRNALRYMRQYGLPLVQGSALALPIRAASFDCVVCARLIEHLPDGAAVFAELTRVLRPGGLLILATPDHATTGWRLLGPLEGGAASGATARYTFASLIELARRHGYELVEQAYVCGSELVVALRLRAGAATALAAPADTAAAVETGGGAAAAVAARRGAED